MTPTQVQNKLCQSLGSEYVIRYIDLERCIYRDYHNGFNLEISGTQTARKNLRCSVYLWLGHTGPFLNYHDITRERLPAVLAFYERLVDELVRRHLNTPEKLEQLRRKTQDQYSPSLFDLPKEAKKDLRKVMCINSEYLRKWMGDYLELLWKNMEEM